MPARSRSPSRFPLAAKIALGAVGAVAAVSILGSLLKRAVLAGATGSGAGGTTTIPLPGGGTATVTIDQPVSSIAMTPKSTASAQLALVAPNNFKLPTSLTITYDAGSTVSVVPPSGVVSIASVSPTSSTVTAVGEGPSVITVSPPGDTQGVNDAVASVAVVT